MQRKIIMSGFGGQGIMAMGQMLTYAGMLEDYYVSWMPSYGPEMRGGSANCSVIISDQPIGAPNISVATDVIVMNQPSLDKFASYVENGGNLFINTSLIKVEEEYPDLNVFKVDSTRIANEMGNAKMANMVMLGAFLEVTNLVNMDSILTAFTKVFGDNKAKLIPINKQALERGRGEINVESGHLEDYKKTPESFAVTDSDVSKVNMTYDDSIFNSDIETTEYAINSETEGIRFYQIMAERFKNQNGYEIFESLAKQEEEHIDYLKNLLSYLKGEKNTFENLKKLENESIEWNEFSGENNMIISSFSVGMGLESDAINFYKKAAEKCSDENAKSLFKELIYWEEFHYEQLKGQYDFYRDRWWADQSFSRM